MLTETTLAGETPRTADAMTVEQTTLPTRRAWNAVQVGARLGCSGRHVYRMADSGTMPWGFKLRSLRRWDADEIENWITEGCPPVRKAAR